VQRADGPLSPYAHGQVQKFSCEGSAMGLKCQEVHTETAPQAVAHRRLSGIVPLPTGAVQALHEDELTLRVWRKEWYSFHLECEVKAVNSIKRTVCGSPCSIAWVCCPAKEAYTDRHLDIAAAKHDCLLTFTREPSDERAEA